jgi:phosphate starvation-inducible protein PhoH
MDFIEKKLRLDTTDTLTLFGYNDSNLRILENHFDATITVRGNTVLLRGDTPEVRRIEKVLNELQFIIRRAGTLTASDVVTVIDLVGSNKLIASHPAASVMDVPVITSREHRSSQRDSSHRDSSHREPRREMHRESPNDASKSGFSRESADNTFRDDRRESAPETPEEINTSSDHIIYLAQGESIKARTPTQKLYFDNVRTNDIVFGIGPAGTGKTYLAVAMALGLLRNREVSRLILSRPAVDAGESLGFLPGDYMEKVDPYLRPLLDALSEMVTAEKLKSMMEKRIVEVTPLAYMRGRTFNNSVIILDEAQNATATQMKMFLTRMGRNSKLIITGDVTQIDLPRRTESGLVQIQEVLRGIQGIAFVYFEKSDVVRHKLVADIIDAYERYGVKQEAYWDERDSRRKAEQPEQPANATGSSTIDSLGDSISVGSNENLLNTPQAKTTGELAAEALENEARTRTS